jgi:hypothetical protein
LKVLIACEFSGIVRDAFIKRGHDAVSCDLLPSERPGPHYQGDVFDIIDDGFDMMIAHPPCTYLSNAGACRLYPVKGVLDKERYKKGIAAKKFFLRLLNTNINKICIENPVSSLVFKMPPHSQEVQPYEYGHPYTKKTRLWLKNLPALTPTKIIPAEAPYCPAGTGRKDRTKYGAAIRGNDAKNRSRFWEGIADAMADQWGSI